MQEKLDFSVPQKKPKGSFGNALVILLLLSLLVIAIVNLVFITRNKNAAQTSSSYNLTAEQTKDLASKLASRSLYSRSIQVWKDYLSTADIADDERATILFNIGSLLEKAGDYAGAIEFYYRSEMTGKADKLQSQINSHVKDCYENLGKFSALRYELMDRTSLKGSVENSAEKIVAEIGAEKITMADLDAFIEQNIETQLSSISAFLTTEQLNEQKKQLVQQYNNTQARLQFLQNYIAQEILYRQALQQQLDEDAEVKQLLKELTRSVLSQQLMNEQLASKINITESDLRNWYTANKDDYTEPAQAKIAHIVVEDQEKAVEIINSINTGQSFSELAKELSLDESTKDNGGLIEADITPGSYVPGIGSNSELNEKIFAAEPNTVLDEPVQSKQGWEVIKIIQKQPSQQKTFEQVSQQVASDLLAQKQTEVQQQYIRQMMDNYNVIIHQSVFTPQQQDESTGQAVIDN